MASNILVTRREYTNQFRAEKTSWLLGNVGDIITLELDTEVQIESISSLPNVFKSNGLNEFTRTTGSFPSEGFSVGSVISWSTTVTTSGTTVTHTGSGTITILNPTFMRVTLISGTFPPINAYPYNDGTNSTTNLNILSSESIDALIFNYNFIANSDIGSSSLNSLVDNSIPTLKAVGLNASDTITIIPFTPISFSSGISFLNAHIKGAGVSGNIQKFTTVLEFQLMPLFEDFADFATLTAPSFLFGIESLTDVFSFKFLPQISNPNISLSADSTTISQLGNVGWFNENYDGNLPLYTKINSIYTDSALATVSSIRINDITNFEFSINQPNNTNTSKYKFGFAFVPLDKTIIERNNKYNYENILYNGLGNTPLTQTSTSAVFLGATNDFGAGMDIQFLDISAVGDTVTIKGQFQPNSQFKDYFKSISIDDWNYVCWISCADESLQTTYSDRVSVLVDQNQLIEKTEPFVLGDVNIEFLNHAQSPLNVGSAIYDGCVEDEILTNSIMFLDLSKNETVNQISFVLEGENDVTGETYLVEQFNVNTAVFPIDANNVQQIAFNSTRGFRMASGVNKNLIEIIRLPSSDVGTKKAYAVRYAFRNRWEYWVANNLVPNSLVDGTKPLNGKNQNWANRGVNWSFRFKVQTQLNSNGILLNTENEATFNVAYFEESLVFTGSITHFNESKTSNLFVGLNTEGIRQNAILDLQKTLIQADFDLIDTLGDVGSVGDWYGVIRIEKYENGGINGIEMLSSVLTNTNDILKPISGELKCKIQRISSTKIRLTGLIDNSFLDVSSTYKTSARIGHKNIIESGIYGSEYGTQYA